MLKKVSRGQQNHEKLPRMQNITTGGPYYASHTLISKIILQKIAILG